MEFAIGGTDYSGGAARVASQTPPDRPETGWEHLPVMGELALSSHPESLEAAICVGSHRRFVRKPGVYLPRPSLHTGPPRSVEAARGGLPLVRVTTIEI